MPVTNITSEWSAGNLTFKNKATGVTQFGITTSGVTDLTMPSGSVAAAGTAQGNGTALSQGFNLVTAANGSAGVVLPTPRAGLTGVVIKVDDNSATGNGALKVYPPSSMYINALGQNNALTMGNGTLIVAYAGNATHWFTQKTPS